MLLFKPCHVVAILNGQKTQTRRIWKKVRCKVGAIHLAKTQMLVKKYFAKLRIKKVWEERLGNLSKEDATKEGGYTPEEYVNVWKEINGDYDPDIIVWVVEFEVVK